MKAKAVPLMLVTDEVRWIWSSARARLAAPAKKLRCARGSPHGLFTSMPQKGSLLDADVESFLGAD